MLMCFSPLRTALALADLIPSFARYTQMWDQRDLVLRQAKLDGKKDVVVQTFKDHPELRDIRGTIWVIGDMEPDPNHWINHSACMYYGLNSITAVKK
jgi:hypothetical protein